MLQHVIVRGIERRDIFLDDGDRRLFLERLSRLLIETGTVLGVVFTADAPVAVLPRDYNRGEICANCGFETLSNYNAYVKSGDINGIADK